MAAITTAQRTPNAPYAPRWMTMIVLLLAFAIRGRVMMSLNEQLERDPDGYARIAIHLNRDWEYGSVLGAGPTAYRPPLYPMVLALCMYFPVPPFGVLHVLLGAGTVWGVWRLGELAGLPPAGSLLAAILVAADPILINQSVRLMSETLAAFLATWSLVSLARLAREPSVPRCVLAGAWIGLCVLCRPTFLVWAGAVAVALPFCLAALRPRAVFLTAILATEAAAIVAPWALRNWDRFGAPIVTTTHGGYTLLLANNPDFYEYLRSGAWGSTWDAARFHEQWAAELREIAPSAGANSVPNELEADRRAYELAWEDIRNEPLMFVYSCAVRVGRLWAIAPHQLSPDESPSRRGMRYATAIWYVAEFTLAAFGLWTLGRKLLTSPWIWGVLLAASFTAVHAFFWTDMRMRAPLIGMVALAAAVGTVRLLAARRVVKPVIDTA